MATTLPRNADVADQFDLLADLLELEGAQSFRVLAYRRAATQMRESAASIAQLALDGHARDLPGVGRTIEDKIVQIVRDGEINALSERKARVPAGVIAMMRLPGLGPKTARRIWEELGVASLDELRQAASEQRLRALPGLGAKTEENVLRALAAEAAGPPRTLLGRALPAALAVVSVLAEHPAAERVSEAGSVRRRTETVRDLDIIATAADPAALTDYFTRLTWVAEIAAKGPTKATVVAHDGMRFDLRVVPPDSYGNLLQHFTGSKEHNVALREDAVRHGLSVSEYGVQDVATGEVFSAENEDEVYARLGYSFIPPELRENRGELEAARAGKLPRLAELADLRGDLHAHSDWSADGRASIEEMALAARGRGYEYLAVTDHSHYLGDGRFEAQVAEIAALNERLAPFRLLRGVEVNIRADGSLDFPDEKLEACDWVVASVHSSFELDVSERVLSAMENPRVDCIGHLTGRKLNRRRPASVDVERVVEAALATGTLLEINSQPDRLDLSDVHARIAGEAGVPIVVSSDAHRVDALANVDFGVAQARRAWLTREQVANARPWPEIAALLRR